jgi:8-oxo-dGTP pyrophosphatase MutT (NUDIX family)
VFCCPKHERVTDVVGSNHFQPTDRAYIGGDDRSVMEMTRHFTATTYVVNDGAAVLHDHKRLDLWLAPGGHIDRDELPHEAALREVREETGLDATLVAETDDIESDTAQSLPKPRHFQLADVNYHDGEVGHQHIDLIFYAESDTRDIAPESDSDEASPQNWEWFSATDLLAADKVAPDVTEIGRRAIETIDARR